MSKENTTISVSTVVFLAEQFRDASIVAYEIGEALHAMSLDDPFYDAVKMSYDNAVRQADILSQAHYSALKQYNDSFSVPTC